MVTKENVKITHYSWLRKGRRILARLSIERFILGTFIRRNCRNGTVYGLEFSPVSHRPTLGTLRTVLRVCREMRKHRCGIQKKDLLRNFFTTMMHILKSQPTE